VRRLARWWLPYLACLPLSLPRPAISGPLSPKLRPVLAEAVERAKAELGAADAAT
jgi:hypothetical protein